jgi:uncharacterized protein
MLSLGMAYFFWGLNILLNAGVDNIMGMALLVLGGISPTVAAMILISRKSKKERSIFFNKLVLFKSIKFQYWLFIILLPLVILFTAIGSTLFLTNSASVVTAKTFQPFLNIVPFAITVLIMGPVPEEIGWRGYLLGALETKFSLLKASLLLAAVWSLWHLPLFFIKDYPLSQMLNQPVSMIAYFILLFPKSIVYSWLFIKTGRSIAAAILFHFFINFYGMIWETSVATQYAELVVWTVLAVLIILKIFCHKGSKAQRIAKFFLPQGSLRKPQSSQGSS